MTEFSFLGVLSLEFWQNSRLRQSQCSGQQSLTKLIKRWCYKGFSQQTPFWSLSGLGREGSKVFPSDDITILASSELNEQRDAKSMLLTVHMHNVSWGGIDDKPLELRVNTAWRVRQERGEDTAELPAFKTRSMFVLVNHILIEAKKQRNNNALNMTTQCLSLSFCTHTQ